MDTTSLVILQTKLHRPRPQVGVVDRPRLLARLHDALAARLTLVTAPAGFGKTTLVASWLQQAPSPVAWLSLDGEDNEPLRFLRYLIAALRLVQADFGEHLLALLDTTQPPAVDTFWPRLINALADLPTPLLLVLDDYHVIEEAAIHSGLDLLLERMPLPFHLVLTSRSAPPLSLARLRARGQLVEISTADLRFTHDETAAFLQPRLQLTLPDKEVADLEARTEGWAAALQFAALSLRHVVEPREAQRLIRSWSGRDRHVVDYLMSEVVQRQPTDVQHFLLRTSVLERLCGPLCDAVLAEGEGGKIMEDEKGSSFMLEYLERANLFLVPLDNERCWYRYHHLFAELLRSRLVQSTTAEVMAALHRRASDWYAQAALVEEAIHHAWLAQDFAHTTQLLEALLANQLWRHGAFLQLRRWIGRLPTATLLQHPLLTVRGASASLMSYDLSAFAHYVGLLERTPQLPPAVHAEFLALQATILRVQENTRDTQALLQQAMDLAPEDDLDVQIVVKQQMAGVLLNQYDLAGAQRLISEVIELSHLIDNSYSVAVSSALLGMVNQWRGELRQARAIYLKAQARLLDLPQKLLPPAGMLDIGLGELHYEWNDLAAAARHAGQAVALGEQLEIGDLLWWGYPLQLRIAQRQGDLLQLASVMQKIERLTQKLSLPSLIGDARRYYDYWTIEVALWQEDWPTLNRWIAARGLSVHQPPKAGDEELKLLARIRIYQARAQGDSQLLDGVVPLLLHLIDWHKRHDYGDAVISPSSPSLTLVAQWTNLFWKARNLHPPARQNTTPPTPPVT